MKPGYYIDYGKNKLTKCITSKAYAEHLFETKSRHRRVRLIEMYDIAPRVLRGN